MAAAPIVVKLTSPELTLALHVATMRNVYNIKKLASPRYGADEVKNAWHLHGISCIGEMAVAKHLDKFWSGAVGNYEAADVGVGYQVRATDHYNGRLVVHPDDKDEMPYILARVRHNVVTLVGWLYGREAKRPDYWVTLPGNPDRPAFFAPNDALHPMSDLASVEIGASKPRELCT